MVENVCIGVTCMCVCYYVCVRVCSWVRFMGADEMKNGRCLKYMCLQNANPNNKEGLHAFQPSYAACGFNSTTPLP